MEERYKMPSGDEMGRMGKEIMAYASEMCEEAGYPWTVAFVLIDNLNDANMMYLKLFDLLGVETMERLGEAIMNSEAYEAIRQAEDALREGE